MSCNNDLMKLMPSHGFNNNENSLFSSSNRSSNSERTECQNDSIHYWTNPSNCGLSGMTTRKPMSSNNEDMIPDIYNLAMKMATSHISEPDTRDINCANDVRTFGGGAFTPLKKNHHPRNLNSEWGSWPSNTYSPNENSDDVHLKSELKPFTMIERNDAPAIQQTQTVHPLSENYIENKISYNHKLTDGNQAFMNGFEMERNPQDCSNGMMFNSNRFPALQRDFPLAQPANMNRNFGSPQAARKRPNDMMQSRFHMHFDPDSNEIPITPTKGIFSLTERHNRDENSVSFGQLPPMSVSNEQESTRMMAMDHFPNNYGSPSSFSSRTTTSSSSDLLLTPNKGCAFCKNNSYHSTFYKSHTLKDDRGHCSCPVLRAYVCPLCRSTGDSAHTLKYCPLNAVTRGDPVAAGLPPGKVTNWKDIAKRMAHFNHAR